MTACMYDCNPVFEATDEMWVPWLSGVCDDEDRIGRVLRNLVMGFDPKSGTWPA